jgi:hypothetical protein
VHALDGRLGGVELLLPPVSVLRWAWMEVGDGQRAKTFVTRA